MALGFQTEAKASGDILPIVKWDAKSGAMVKVDRYQDAGGAWTRDENDMDIPVFGIAFVVVAFLAACVTFNWKK